MFKLESDITEKLAEFVDHWNAREHEQIKRPIIEFVYKGTYGGKAYPAINKIVFNAAIAERVGIDDYIQTIIHEFCHILDYAVFGEIGHGKTWKYLMRYFGFEPKRCHSYNVSGLRARKVKRFVYVCGCEKPKQYTKGMHEKIQRANLLNMKVSCRQCHNGLTFEKQIWIK